MKEICFFVPGVPAPGGSKRGFAIKKGGTYTGRVAIVDAGGERTKTWRQDVAFLARQTMALNHLDVLTGPLKIKFIFQLRRPKSHLRSDGLVLRPSAPLHPITRPDCTKLARSTEDAITGICWADDAQIVKQTHEKVFSDPAGAWVLIQEIA